MTESAAIQRTLESLARERQELIERLQKIDAALTSLKALTPGNPVNAAQTNLFQVVPAKTRGSLTDALQKALSDRKPRDLDELVAELKARGFDFGSKSAKRAVNFALQGLKNAKRVETTAYGWRLRA